jgi:xanthosine utilization system XapX-like protein
VVSHHKPSPQSKNSSLKLHLSLVNKIGDVVGHVTALLTPGSLVAVVMHLLGVAGDEVKTKALKIVARKLEEGKSYFASDQDECLVQLLGAVVGVAKSDSSHLLTRHSAVYCVKLLARRLAHNNHHSNLTQALQEMLSLLSNSDGLSSEFTGSCLLAVAELSSSLGPHLIPYLPSSLPPVMNRLTEGVGVMVQTAAVATLGVIVQTLPKFLSSFAATIVQKARG